MRRDLKNKRITRSQKEKNCFKVLFGCFFFVGKLFLCRFIIDKTINFDLETSIELNVLSTFGVGRLGYG